MTYDFVATFPAINWDSAEAYRVFAEEADDEAIRSVHEEIRAEIAGLMLDLRMVQLAQREGFHPKTGKRPATDKQQDKLEELFKTEPDRLAATIEGMLGAYADVFGLEASEAFRTHCERFADQYWEPPPRQLSLF